MKVLKNHEFVRRTAGARKHDWTELLDGQTRQLESADMGDAKASTFGGQARIQAKKRGMAVHFQITTDDKGNETGAILQAYKPTAEQLAAAAARTPKATKAKAGKGK